MPNPSQSGCKDPYPWLESSDPRRHMSDLQILYDRIDLSDSLLTSREKSKLMALIVKYKKAFSLRDEIGHCPNLKADLKVIDDSAFFVRPFPIGETDKPFYGPSDGTTYLVRHTVKEQYQPYFPRYAHHMKTDKGQMTRS